MPPSFELSPWLIHTHQQEMENLGKIERDASRRLPREQRRQLQAQANNIRERLSQTSSPEDLYLYMKATRVANADAFREKWEPQSSSIPSWQRKLALPDVRLETFPPGSFYIEIPFTLAKPYLSKDDNEFYIVDNPVQREKVFRWPMVRSTSWKGALRSTMRHLGEIDEETEIRLFGETRDDDTGHRGNLYFFSSFFSEVDLEIINPHERESGTGTLPILFESVPIGATSNFYLLYVPFNCQSSPRKTLEQAVQDLALVISGVHAMLLTYGFGAKTSSGYGMAQDKLPKKGRLLIRQSDGILPLPPLEYLTHLKQQAWALANKYQKHQEREK